MSSAEPTPFRKDISASLTSSTSAQEPGMPSRVNNLRESGIGILACALSSAFFPAFAATSPATAPILLTTGFAVLPADPGPWPQILSSVGFQKQSPAVAGILVLRPGATSPSQLAERIEQGAIVILEG